MNNFKTITVPNEIALEAEYIYDKYLQKFNSRCFVNEVTGCWEWTGYKTWDGYGKMWVLDENYAAHRVSLWLRGVIPLKTSGDWLKVIDHLCKNTSCVNPKHLEIVTAEENLKRAQPWLRKL